MAIILLITGVILLGLSFVTEDKLDKQTGLIMSTIYIVGSIIVSQLQQGQ